MKNVENNWKSCTGCLSCAAVCPFGAISIIESDEGFYIPKVDQKKCTECGLCLKRCSITNPHVKKKDPLEALAAYNKDAGVRHESSSGGVFAAIAERILEQGGCVVGAVWDEMFNVKHEIAFDSASLIRQRGSKYVQSFIAKELYKEIKEILENGTLVLFSGTGCQVAGLLKYLNKQYLNLITIDVLCHGVSSNVAWREYLTYIKNEKGCGEIKSINMRDKTVSWDLFSYNIVGNRGSYIEVGRNDYYARIHSSGVMLRPSCEVCKFKRDTGYVYSDISIGDYWGGGKIGDNSEKEGISLIIANTEKGKELIKTFVEKLTVFPVNLKEAAIINHVIYHPDARYLLRKNAIKDLQKADFVRVAEKHLKLCSKQRKIEFFVFRVKRKLLKTFKVTKNENR